MSVQASLRDPELLERLGIRLLGLDPPWKIRMDTGEVELLEEPAPDVPATLFDVPGALRPGRPEWA